MNLWICFTGMGWGVLWILLCALVSPCFAIGDASCVTFGCTAMLPAFSGCIQCKTRKFYLSNKRCASRVVLAAPKILDYRFNISSKSKWPVAQRLIHIQQRRKWHSTHNMTAFSGVLAWKLWLFRLKIFTQTSINCGWYSRILQMAAPVTDQCL